LKNLVMSVATGYGWNDLEPFVISCKNNCPGADLILFVDNISKFTENKLETGGGVQLLPIPENLKSMTIVCSRFIMYKDFLDAHAEYDKVFVSDVSDVIFQGDIFKVYPGQDKFISYSNCCYFIKDEPTNTQWIKNNFSDAEYDKIKKQSSCRRAYVLRHKKRNADFTFKYD